MSDSAFDPNAFLDASTTEAAVKRPLLPAGQIFNGVIENIDFRSGQQKKDPTKSWASIDLKVKIDLQPYRDRLPPDFAGMDTITLQPNFLVDLTPDGRGFDWSPGKNGQFRRWREALGLNVPGQSFSPRMMQGRLVGLKISHRTYEGEMYDQVDSPVKV